jgi:pimeloyl-ACP methyl ester carboxylesterase
MSPVDFDVLPGSNLLCIGGQVARVGGSLEFYCRSASIPYHIAIETWVREAHANEWRVNTRRKIMRKINSTNSLVLTTFVAIALAVYTVPASADSDNLSTTPPWFSPHCFPLTLPVALGAGLPVTDSISGTLCLPANIFVRTVDVLVPGGTYTRTYFDWPVRPELYSYVRHALAAGRATFALDKVGTGDSSKPVSTSVTMEANAYTVHQVIQLLKSSHDMDKVNLVSHSVGSMISVFETALYHDADRVVLTGMLHALGPGVQTSPADFYPANLDPQFTGIGYDSGWLTTLPGTRSGLFYYAKTADPAVIAYDEAHKSVESATNLVEALNQKNAPAGLNFSNQITVPVLHMAGEFDLFGCQGAQLDCSNSAAVLAFEAPYFTSAPCLTTGIVANTGHDLNLHPSAPQTYKIINRWLSESLEHLREDSKEPGSTTVCLKKKEARLAK